MRLINKDNFVKVKSSFKPSIKTMKEAILDANGRSRQYIEQQDLTWGVILCNDETGDHGVKVIVDDRKYKDFIKACKSYDLASSIRKKNK